MTGLIIFFLVSLSILSWGFSALKEIYLGLNGAMAKRHHAEDYIQPTMKEIILMVGGIVFGVVGAVLYYLVCAATVEDIIKPRNPVESPTAYGIALVMTSLVFSGGFAVCDFVMEDERRARQVAAATSIVVLMVDLLLKVSRVLP